MPAAGREPAVTPNLDAQGQVIARPPSRSAGSWRGRQGYHAITKVVDNSRFRIRAHLRNELLWVAWHVLNEFENVPNKLCPPLECRVCAVRPTKLTFLNFVSKSKCTGECGCSWRPAHATLAGRATLQRKAAQVDSELVDTEGDWVELHLRRSERWRMFAVRCTKCQRKRYVACYTVSGDKSMPPCLCVRLERQREADIARRARNAAKMRARAQALAAARRVLLPDDAVAALASQ